MKSTLLLYGDFMMSAKVGTALSETSHVFCYVARPPLPPRKDNHHAHTHETDRIACGMVSVSVHALCFWSLFVFLFCSKDDSIVSPASPGSVSVARSGRSKWWEDR